MTILVRGLSALLVLTVALAPLGAQDIEETQTVGLERVMRHPLAFKGLIVSFVVQFHELGSIDNPVYTRFERDWYQNFSAWPDSAELWKRQEYLRDFPYLFVSRMSEGATMIAHAKPYSRWLISGVVSEVFLDQPWIEVKGLQELDTRMNPGSLRHIVQGFRLTNDGRWGEAALAFRAADDVTLPTNVRLMTMREEAMALHYGGRSNEAVARLDAALELHQSDHASLQAMTLCRASLGQDPSGNPLPVAAQPVSIPAASTSSRQQGTTAVTSEPVADSGSEESSPSRSSPEPWVMTETETVNVPTIEGNRNVDTSVQTTEPVPSQTATETPMAPAPTRSLVWQEVAPGGDALQATQTSQATSSLEAEPTLPSPTVVPSPTVTVTTQESAPVPSSVEASEVVRPEVSGPEVVSPSEPKVEVPPAPRRVQKVTIELVPEGTQAPGK
jgi:hypothetical protein